MLTYTYISKGKFGLVEKPKPTIQHERDAIVKVTLASICSSDQGRCTRNQQDEVSTRVHQLLLVPPE